MIQTRCARCRKKIDYKTGLCPNCTKTARETYRNNNKSKDTEYLIKNSTWKAIRQSVIRRDKGCCRICLNNNRISFKRLEVHHILKRADRPDLVYDLNNLVTVCRGCHEMLEKLPALKQRELIGCMEVENIEYL